MNEISPELAAYRKKVVPASYSTLFFTVLFLFFYLIPGYTLLSGITGILLFSSSMFNVYLRVAKKDLAKENIEYSNKKQINMDPKVRAKRYAKSLVLFPILGFAVLFYGIGSGKWLYSNLYFICWIISMIWLFFGIMALSIANQASAKGKNWVSFFWLSILISPLVTWLIISSIQPEQGKILEGNIPCPKCAEPIKAAAKLCKHCGSTV